MTDLKADNYGGVLVDADGRVLLREPASQYGGYLCTFTRAAGTRGSRRARRRCEK